MCSPISLTSCILFPLLYLTYEVCLLHTHRPDVCASEKNCYKSGVINDQLGQINKFASNKHCFQLKFVVLLDFEKWGRTYGRTTCVKIIITTCRDCGVAEWINTHRIVFSFTYLWPGSNFLNCHAGSKNVDEFLY